MSGITTDLWLYWLQLTARHAAAAQSKRDDSLATEAVGPEKIQATLEEATQTMIAVAAASFTVDGFANAVRHELDAAGVPVQWPNGRPRPVQLTSVLKAGFVLKPTQVDEISDKLTRLFKTRNHLVHDGSRTDSTWLHPSGLSVSQFSKDLAVEQATQSLAEVKRILDLCLPNPIDPLRAWARERRRAVALALEG